MKKKISIILLIAIIFTQALAQLGASKEDLLEQLSVKYVKTVLGYTNGKNFDFSFTERGKSLMLINGTTVLNENNIKLLTEMIVKSTGYDSIAENVSQFFTTQAADLNGKGQQAIDLAEYRLLVEVSGGNPLYELKYSLEVLEIPQEKFLKSARALGPEDAKYVIREFSDFECPFCAKFAAEGFPQIKEKLISRGDVRFEYHHFPLISIHQNAFAAAEASECVAAAKADDFWVFHDALFENGQAWSKLENPNPYFVRLAKDLGLESDAVKQCLEDRTVAISIDDAYNQAGGVLGIRGTPTLFINGFKVLDVNNIDNYLKIMKMIDGFDGE